MRGDGLSRPLPLPRARGTSSRGNERAGALGAIRLNYFIPSVPSFFRAAAAVAAAGYRPREKDGESAGERNAGEDKADKDEGKEERGIRRKPLSTFYTSGYCIRIYYNLRIPEESDSGRRGTSGEGRGGHRFEGRRKRDR